MDLLGSILDKMDKPPSISDKQKEAMKKQKEMQEKLKKAETEKLNQFRKKVEAKINLFINNDTDKEYKFQPMDKIYRSIIHDVAEMANVFAYSFGEEGVDRYITIFKKEYPPSEDQLNALKNGEEWNDEIAKRVQAEKESRAKEEEEEFNNRKRKQEFKQNSSHEKKYHNLIGKETAVEIKANSSYGCVPSSNKKDQRSIEQTLADIRAKKRKLEEEKKKDENEDSKSNEKV